MNVIESCDVHRDFGDVHALDGLNLVIEQGQIYGLLGPNGAGKTTLLNLLQGLDRPTSGQVRVLGMDPVREHQQLTERIGCQLQQGAVIPRLTVNEVLETFASFYEKPRDVATLIAEVGLQDKATKRVDKLSGGQRQRVFIALAQVNDAELLFFDELTAAVDPQARLAIWDILRGLRADGRTVVLTTHSMEEAQTLCDRVAVIDAGRIIAEGTTPELIANHADGSVLTMHVTPDPDLAALQALEGVSVVHVDQHVLTVTGTGDFVPRVMATLAGAGITITSMNLTQGSLEDVFLALTGRHMRPAQ